MTKYNIFHGHEREREFTISQEHAHTYEVRGNQTSDPNSSTYTALLNQNQCSGKWENG